MELKICLICSAGGHLVELMQLKKLFKNYNHFFITFRREDIKTKLGREKPYFIVDPKRSPLKLMINFFQSLAIFLRERPNVIISTGGGMAIPICIIAKIFGEKVIFIETMAAVCKPSLTGKMVYPFADLFITQWKDVARFYPKAVYGGLLI